MHQIFTEWLILEVLGGVAVDVGNKTATTEVVGVVEEHLVFGGLFGGVQQGFEGFEAHITWVKGVVVDAEAVEIAAEAFGHVCSQLSYNLALCVSRFFHNTSLK